VLDRMQSGVRDQMSNRSDRMNEDSLGFLWQKWTRMERYFGDAASVRRCMAFRDSEFRNLQRDQSVDEESVVESPATLLGGLSMSIHAVEEGFRFQHLVPHTATAQAMAAVVAESKAEAAGSQANSATGASAKAAPLLQSRPKATAGSAPATTATGTSGAGTPAGASIDASGPIDSVVLEASEQHNLSDSAPAAALSVHIARPDVSKMLSFRPALDVVGVKKAADAGARGVQIDDDQSSLPSMIPKCLQDLLAVLPAKPLKGAKPDVDYLLTVLQTVSIPPIQVKELERSRYDSLRLLKEEDHSLLRRRGLVKDEFDGDSSFYSSRSTVYRERLQLKRQRLLEERLPMKPEGGS